MQLYRIFAFTALATTSFGNAIARTTDLRTTLDFDKIETPVTALKPIDLYKKVKFDGFASANLSSNLLGGFVPNTGDIVAGATFRTRLINTITQVLAGDPLKLESLAPPASFTVLYGGSDFTSFDLSSLYFSVALAVPVSTLVVTLKADVAFEGYNANGKRVATLERPYTAQYRRGEFAKFNMDKVKFGRDFDGISTLKVRPQISFLGLDVTAIIDPLLAIAIDTVELELKK